MTVSTQLMNLVNMKAAEHVVIVTVSMLSLASILLIFSWSPWRGSDPHVGTSVVSELKNTSVPTYTMTYGGNKNCVEVLSLTTFSVCVSSDNDVSLQH